MLREQNLGGRGGCPDSNIFVHGFRFLDMRFDKTIWFLGAPDYLCETNSFVTAIANAKGEWVVGKASEKGWMGNTLLAGAPKYFRYSPAVGYLLTSEWQVEGPINFLYHSADAKTWSSVPLPSATRKDPDGGCCYAEQVVELCLSEAGDVYISYAEDDIYFGGVWASRSSESFPTDVTWTQKTGLPEDADCDRGPSPAEFIPRSLREKTDDGAVFEVFPGRFVRIPGPTR